MKQTFKKYVAQLTFLVAGIFIATGLSIAGAAGDWKAPTANPPGDNVDAPINVGPANQVKIGALTMGGAVINGGLYLINGSQGDGKILVSDADGLATWTSPEELNPVECVGEGLIWVSNDGTVSDSGNSREDDDLEVYCRKGVARFCLSGENCPWRVNIRSADNLVCSSSGNLSSGATTDAAGRKRIAHVTDGYGWRGYNYFFCSTDGTSKDAYHTPRHEQSGQNGIKVR